MEETMNSFTVSGNWYEDFFKGINCELWEKAVPQEWTQQEVAFLVAELGLQPGAQVLDVPCGFGRHAVELARRGFRVTGIDISSTFIEGLKQRIASEGLSVTPILADVLSVDIAGRFDGAICMGNSFGYFDAAKMDVFVGKVAAALEKGARWVINSGMLAESALADFERERPFTVGDIQMDIANTYLMEEGCMVSEILYTRGGLQERHAFKHYVFTLSEVRRMLEKHGMKFVAAYGSLDGAAYKLGDGQVYIVVEKG
jgi:cyclopropane fatty-acyl-phospholipid synthase-like methyltransferase